MADQGSKTILIGAKVDASLRGAAQAVKREMEQLAKQADLLTKSLGPGKNTQSPGFGRLIQNQLKDLKTLQKQAGETFKTIASDAERMAQKETASLTRVQSVVAKLTKEFTSLSLAQQTATGAYGELKGNGSSIVRRAQMAVGLGAAQARSGSGAYSAQHPSYGGLGNASYGGQGPPGGYGWNGGPPGGGGGNTIPGAYAAQPPQPARSLSNADVALIGASVGKAIGGALQQAGGFVQGLKNMDANNLAAASQSSIGRILGSALNGDVRLQYAAANLRDASGKGTIGNQLDPQAGGRNAGGAALVGQGIGGVAGVVGGVATMLATKGAGGVGKGGGPVRTAGDISGAGSGIAGSLMDIASPIASFANGGLDVQEIQSMTQRGDSNLANNPFFSAAADLIQQEKHARAAASRKLMSRHLSASGLGAGYGYGREESFGIAGQLQGLNGMDGMFGTYGTRKVDTMSRKDLASLGIGTGQSMTSKLVPLPGQGTNNVAGGRNDVPTDYYGRTESYQKTRGLLQSAMQIAGHGIDMGAGMGSLSSLYQSNGGNSEKAMQSIEKAVALGTQRGFTDPRTQQDLVQFIGQAASGRILQSDQGLQNIASLLTGGMAGGQAQLGQMQSRVQALAGYDQLSGNSYFQGKAMASAMSAGSPLQQGLLGSATVTDLLAGGTRFEDRGITESQRMRQAYTKMQQQVTYATSQSGDAEMQNYLRAAGGDNSYFDEKKNPAAFKALRRTLSTYKEFATDKGSDAAARLYVNEGTGDVQSGTGQAKAMKQYGDQAAFAAISIEERVKQKLETLVDQLGKYMANQDEFMKTLDGAQKDEAAGKNLDIKQNKVFLVKVLAEQGVLTPPPAPNLPR